MGRASKDRKRNSAGKAGGGVSTSLSGGVSQPAIPQPPPVVTSADATGVTGSVTTPAVTVLPVTSAPTESSGDTCGGVITTDEQYAKERALLLDLAKANTDQHDKAILQITGVALAVSVTFVDKIAHNPDQHSYVWLGAGWAALSLGLTAILLSFQTGHWACNSQLDLLNDEYKTGVRPDQRNHWSEYTTWLNRLSCLLLVLGVVLILIFSWVNLPKGTAPDGPSKGDEVSQPQTPKPSSPAEPRPGHGHPAPPSPARPARPATPPIKK